MPATSTTAYGTRGSVAVERCQICDCPDLQPVLFLGYLPPVNALPPVGTRPKEQPAYPAQLLSCPRCQLAQLGCVVDAQILFPPEYPYTSGTTRILRENFVDLARECAHVVKLTREDLVVDIGSNDGTLLSNFVATHRVQGITPEDVGRKAIDRGIPTLISYFNHSAVLKVVADKGRAKLVTATNVFAHIEDVHTVLNELLKLLDDGGVFVSESHYLLSLVETLQYDTIYHEHLRYYSLHSLKYLLEMHGLEVFHARTIPTHGGSIRVYASRKGTQAVQDSVRAMLAAEQERLLGAHVLATFKERVVLSKLELHSLLLGIKRQGGRIYGVGAPSRASTLINYVGIDDGIMSCALEIAGSNKIGKYFPGTVIPIVEESALFSDQPEYALLLSWHIADELAPKLRQKGFRGRFITPLPKPAVD